MKIQHQPQLSNAQIKVQFHMVIITLLLLFWIDSVQATTGARSPYQRYTPTIEVYPQNFAIAEDQLGNVYVGNSDGLLQYDGNRWSLTAMPNGDIVRSLSSAPNNRIYVGGSMNLVTLKLTEQENCNTPIWLDCSSHLWTVNCSPTSGILL
jgi:ligand-binding sensor domain-containing protein